MQESSSYCACFFVSSQCFLRSKVNNVAQLYLSKVIICNVFLLAKSAKSFLHFKVKASCFSKNSTFFQYIHEKDNEVHYFVIGSGNFVRDDTSHHHSIPHNSLKFYWADTSVMGGFAHVSVTPDEMTVNIVNADGKVLYTKEIYPRKA